MFKLKYLTGISITLYLITSIAFANTLLPKHYPSNFDVSGKITKVYSKRLIIELDKAGYYVHPVHDIYTKRKNSKLTLYNLKPGMKIGVKFSLFKGKRVISEIWTLPKSYPTVPHAR